MKIGKFGFQILFFLHFLDHSTESFALLASQIEILFLQ